jgi:zinc protease
VVNAFSDYSDCSSDNLRTNKYAHRLQNRVIPGSEIGISSDIGVDFRATRSLTDAGVALIHQQISAAVVCVDVWLPAGTSSEPENWSGIAHFMEHMIFKGTKEILPGEFDCLIETYGGIANAATSHDYVHFSFTTASDYFAPTLACLAKLLLEAQVPDKEFELERSVVIEEMYQALDNPDWIAHQNLMQTAYGQHPYSRPVLGYEPTLRSLTAADLRTYHDRHYRPENMTVVIVGNIDLTQAKEAVEAAFGIVPIRSPRSNPQGALGLCQIPTVRVQQMIGLEQARMTMAWFGANISQLEDAVQLELLTMVLAGGRSSRLVKSLREEQNLVMEIESDFTVQRSPGLFTISALLDVRYLEPVEAQIQQQISLLSQIPVSQLELERTRRALANQFAFATESPEAVASLLGYYGMLGCESLCENWNGAYGEILNRATPESLQNLAQRYLFSDRYTITCLLPR